MDRVMQEKQERNGFTKKRVNDLIFVYLILLWPVIHFTTFWIIMNMATIKNAFYSETLSGELEFVAWKNFKDVFAMFSGERVMQVVSKRALPNVLYLMLLCIFVNMPITLLFSYMIVRKILGHRVFSVLLFLPAMTSAVVLCLIFRLGIDTRYGFLVEFLNKLGLSKIVPAEGFLGSTKTAWTSIMIFSVWTGISGNIVYYASAMSRVPIQLVESAKIDWASEWKICFKVYIPLMWPTVVTMMISYLSANFAWYIPSLMLCGGDGAPEGTTSTIGLIIIQFTRGASNNGFTSALSVIVGIIGGGFIMLFKYVFEKMFEEVEY